MTSRAGYIQRAGLGTALIAFTIGAIIGKISLGAESSTYSAVVTGKIIRAGKPLAHARVTLRDNTGQEYEPVLTDRAGMYVLSGVKPGNYKLSVQVTGADSDEVNVLVGPDMTNVPTVEVREKPGTPKSGTPGPVSTVTPPSTLASEISANEARKFVEDFWSMREKGNLNYLIGAFAPRVDYYEDGEQDRNAILKDQQKYLSGYPHRVFELGAIDVIKATNDPSDTIRVRFTFQYKLSGKKTATGSSTETWLLRRMDEKLQIIACKGQVVRD